MTGPAPAQPFPRLFEPLRIGERHAAQPDRLVGPRHGDGRRRLRHRPADRLPGGAGRRRRRAHRRPGRGRPRERALHLARADGHRGRLHPRLPARSPRRSTATARDRRPDLPRRPRAHGVDGRHAAGRARAVGRAERAVPRHAAGDADPAHRGDPRRATRRRRGGCATPASTASRSWPATATCPRSSSTRASTCGPTGTAAARRTGCGSCARPSRRSGPRSAASRSSGCGSRSTRSRPRA